MSSRPRINKHFRFNPPMQCIYCGKSDVELTDEHIIPFSLDGNWIFPNASCEDCGKITSRFELLVARNMYDYLRRKEDFQSNRPKKKYFDVIINEIDGSQNEIRLNISKYPSMYLVLQLPIPGILRDAELSETSPEGMKLTIMANPEEYNALITEYPGVAGINFPIGTLVWTAFFRMLAKIAHGVTVGHFGDVGYTQILSPLILGTCPHLSHFVGGREEETEVDPHIMKIGNHYEIEIDNDRKIIIVNIELLNGRCPTYTVVSGYITDLDALLTNASHLKQEGKRVYAHGMRTRHLFIHEWIKWIIECFHHLVSQLYPKLVTDWPLLKGCT